MINHRHLAAFIQQVSDGCPDDPRFDEIDPEGMAKAWSFFENNRIGYAVGLVEPGTEKCVGILLGLCVPDPLTGLLVGTAYLWAVVPEYRRFGGARMLLRDFERWATERGASRLVVGAVESPKADKLARAYRMMGYEPATRGFQKRL